VGEAVPLQVKPPGHALALSHMRRHAKGSVPVGRLQLSPAPHSSALPQGSPSAPAPEGWHVGVAMAGAVAASVAPHALRYRHVPAEQSLPRMVHRGLQMPARGASATPMQP